MKKLIAFGILLAIFSGLKGQSDLYKVYALKFKDAGRNSAVGAVAGAAASDTIDVCYMIWFLKGSNGHNVLIDTGDLDSTQTGVQFYIRPDLLLGDIGIRPDDITDIIITHPHFDHINGLSLFTSGKVWMQKADFEDFTVDSWRENRPLGFNKADVRSLLEASLQGRLNLVDGDNLEIIPGIRVFTGSTHTRANQYVLVTSTDHSKVLLASDAIWFYLNLRRMVPIETYRADPAAYVDAMKRMKTLVSDEKYIIPGHDDQLFSGFEKVNDRVVIIR